MAMNDWWSCDGYRASRAGGGLTRRSVLVGVGLGAAAWLTERSALAQMSMTTSKDRTGNVLVSIFLRGGMDGLNVVTPYAEDAYYRMRPTLALAKPTEGKAATKDRLLDLDGFFGLHPILAPLLPLFHEGSLAIVHAVGSGDQTRSHFEAMNAMERGTDRVSGSGSSGWLARHLNASEPDKVSPMRALALGNTMPDSLRGATGAISLGSLDEFRLAAHEEAKVRAALGELYSEGRDAMAEAGRDTLSVLETLNRLDPKAYKASNGAVYPPSELGQGLKQVAFLVRSGVGLEVACLDRGGWDTHVVQGGSTGLLASNLDDVAKSLAAFSADLGGEMKRVTVTVQTEFGRRAYENGGLGTDHGRASAMFVMGGGVRGGKVRGHWPGLEQAQLEGPGDLRVTTDYRDVLAEVLSKRLPRTDLGKVFPGHAAQSVGVIV